jgi:hypothetical protein
MAQAYESAGASITQRHFHGNVMCFEKECDPIYIFKHSPNSNWHKRINDRFMTKEVAAQVYSETPVWELEQIGPGMSCHIGDGIFLTRCRSCDDFHLAYGAAPRHGTIGMHEVKVHGLDVPGLNSAFMK